MNHLILLAGIPATRKSSFGRWLESNRNVISLDLENHQTDSLKETLRLIMGTISSSIDIEVFIGHLETLGRSVVIDWGFPVSQLPLVDALKQAGFRLWWFNGDRAAARTAFIKRNQSATKPIPVECFDTQMDGIEREWSRISELFGDHVIEVLNSDGSYLSPEQIATRMNV